MIICIAPDKLAEGTIEAINSPIKGHCDISEPNWPDIILIIVSFDIFCLHFGCYR